MDRHSHGAKESLSRISRDPKGSPKSKRIMSVASLVGGRKPNRIRYGPISSRSIWMNCTGAPKLALPAINSLTWRHLKRPDFDRGKLLACLAGRFVKKFQRSNDRRFPRHILAALR